MQLEGKYKLEARPEEVWVLLTNPVYLKMALPGCERIDEKAPRKYEALLIIGIAAFKGTYKARFELADTQYPCSYRLIGKGGGSRGIVSGEALVRLLGQNRNTVVFFRANIELGGALSGVSIRMIKGIAKMMLNQFFKKLKKELVSL